MCLPFLCGDTDTHGSGAHHDHTRPPPQQQQQPATPLDHPGDGGHHPHSYKPPNNNDGAAQGRRAGGGVNRNGEPGAPVYVSDTDAPSPAASVGVVRGWMGAAEKAHGRVKPKVAAPTTWAPQTPEHTEYVAAGARHHVPVTASEPREGATTRTAPVPQVARRDEEGGSPPLAVTSRWK